MSSPRQSRRWLWWLGGGLALLLVMTIAGGVWGVTTLVHRFQSGGLTCLPSDFPRYPGTATMSLAVSVESSPKRCEATFESQDPVTTVEPYYESHLNSGDWAVGSVSHEAGTITFSRRSKATVTGTVRLQELKQGTEISVLLTG